MRDMILPAVAAGFLLDLIFGDPHFLYHPIRLIGKLIEKLERFLRAVFPKNKRGERIAGFLLVIFVVGISTALPELILHFFYTKVNIWAYFALETFWCYQLLATKALKVESMKVYDKLKNGTLTEARQAVSMIVGRDTDALDREGVTKAAVETVAENTADGVIAPLIFMMIAGAAGGFFYKSINTMDSMVAYKNDKYRYFGTPAAKLDDVANFLPSRIGGLLMIAASYLLGMNGKQAKKIFFRDRKKHSSPNSAQTESVMAGALGVQLAGNAIYFGKMVEKPALGDPLCAVNPEDIVKACRLLYATAALALVLTGIIRLLVLLIF